MDTNIKKLWSNEPNAKGSNDWSNELNQKAAVFGCKEKDLWDDLLEEWYILIF